jgi:ATP dependent DNA ligase domain
MGNDVALYPSPVGRSWPEGPPEFFGLYAAVLVAPSGIEGGRPVFPAILLFRRHQSVFIAFDLLFLNGKDLRMLPLLERKATLKKLLRRRRSRILYLDLVESAGRLLFEQIVAMDLEGIVCKRKDSPYKVTDKPSRHWIKVKNSRYSQLEGREELFERL